MIDYSKVMKTVDYGESSLEINRRALLEFRKNRTPQFYDKHPVPEQVKEQVIAIEYVNKERAEFRPSYNGHYWFQHSSDYVFNGVYVDKLEPPNCQPIYILDKDLNIVARVESKNLVGKWIEKNGYWRRSLGRTTAYEYVKNKWLYKDKFYFIPVTEYEAIIEWKKN